MLRRHSRPSGRAACLPVAGFGCNPSEPSSGEIVRFFDYSYDPGHRGIVGWHWTFGDGSVSHERQPTHRYAADGDYTVSLAARTPDGREGAASGSVRVRTHEVAIESLCAPIRCCPGETVDIVTDVSSDRYDELVELRLFVRSSDGEPPAGQADRAIFAVRAGGASAATSATLRATIPAAAVAGDSVEIEVVAIILGASGPTRRDSAREVSICVG